MNLTYHGTPKSHYESLDPTQPYIPPDFDREGFVHCTDGREAISIVLTTHYKEQPGAWLVLIIDKDCVTSPVRYDDPAEVFPHIHGPLNRDAIVSVQPIGRAADGTFSTGKPDYDMPDGPLNLLRAICLALPEVTERLSHGEPTWFVRHEKTFVSYSDHHHNSPRVAFTCAAPPGAQETLVDADPERFFRPPYVGHRGWLGVYLDVPPDWEFIEGLVKDAYRMVAPKALAARLTPAE